MFFSTKKIRIFLYTKKVDGRWGMDRLAHVVESRIGLEPRSGALFVFFNKSMSRVRIFYYDGSGSCLFYKRLEKGIFKFPKFSAGQLSLDIAPTELALLLEGCDLKHISKPRPWQPTEGAISH